MIGPSQEGGDFRSFGRTTAVQLFPPEPPNVIRK